MKNMLKVLALTAAVAMPSASFAAGGYVDIPQQEWEFTSLTKGWDKDTMYRGYQVATQVCLSCHSFEYISHRNLKDVGFSEAEVKTLAKALEIGVNDKMMSGLSNADAKEAYGKVLPDLSLLTRARPDGVNYTHALLTGYTDDEAPDGTYYNKYFPGHFIGMPPPLSNGLIEYHDGTEANVDQMARDVTYFMAWAAEPEMKERERVGVFALIYVIFFTILAYMTKNRIWSRLKK